MNQSERIAAILTSLAGTGIMYYAWSTLKLGNIHMPDAGLLPFLCGTSLLILGILWFATVPKRVKAAGTEDAGKDLWYRPYASLALMVLYALALENIGYVTSTLVFMLAWQQVVERERWIKTILIALLSTTAMYLLFKTFLTVPIPQDFFLR